MAMVVLPEPPFGFSTTMRCMKGPVLREYYVVSQFSIARLRRKQGAEI
jgi:hypothetical protein